MNLILEDFITQKIKIHLMIKKMIIHQDILMDQ